MEYSYYIFDYNGINRLYRISKEGMIHENPGTLAAFIDGKWTNDNKYTGPFMDNYLTGWLDERDAMNYEAAMKLLTMDRLDLARKFAVEKHGKQKYGHLPYETHLTNVVNVLLRTGILPDSKEKCDLWISAWLHDILEDTTTTSNELVAEFGKEVYEIVWALTDGEKGDRFSKKLIMYKKLVHNQAAMIVKLADRISNLEFSILLNNQRKIRMYLSENVELNTHLSDAIISSEGKILLRYLNELVAKYSFMMPALDDSGENE